MKSTDLKNKVETYTTYKVENTPIIFLIRANFINVWGVPGKEKSYVDCDHMEAVRRYAEAFCKEALPFIPARPDTTPDTPDTPASPDVTEIIVASILLNL